MRQRLFFVFLLTGILSVAAAPRGAIFTTTVDGSAVNANLYESKCSVYLDGGPGPNAPAGAAGLPDGEYYFQVTDPSGNNCSARTRCPTGASRWPAASSQPTPAWVERFTPQASIGILRAWAPSRSASLT